MGVSYIEEYRRRYYVLKKDRELRELNDYFEYCLIKDYYSEFQDFNANVVKLGNVFAAIIVVAEDIILASIRFPKKQFTVEEIISWLNQYAIFIQKADNSNRVLVKAHRILLGLRIHSHVLILYQKGQESLNFNPDEYYDAADIYFNYDEPQNSDTNTSIPPVENKNKQLVFFNGEPLEEIPHLEFDQLEDTIVCVCNGTLICADYIDDYYGTLGFFRNALPDNPVAFLNRITSPIRINLEEGRDGGTVCVIEYEY
jgi:hypothetical protein